MLDGKVIVVIGAAGLLGREFVKAIVMKGGTVVLADIAPAAAEATLAEVRKFAPDTRSGACAVDITDGASVDALIAETTKRHGRIDGMVNAAYPRNAKDRKSTRLNSSHIPLSRMPSSA